MSPLRKSAEGLQQSFKDGARGAIPATGGKIIPAPSATPPANPEPASGPPAWAKAMKDHQASTSFIEILASCAVAPIYCTARAACCTVRSEEHTSELQSLMRISYAVFCLKK